MKAHTITTYNHPLNLEPAATQLDQAEAASDRHTYISGAAGKLAPLDPATLLVEIVIPAYNEEHSLPDCITTLHNYMAEHLSYRYRLTIADNGSRDDTWAIAQQLAALYPEVRTVHLDAKGRGRALKSVWQNSDADILAYMDVDLSTGLDSFLPMIEPLVAGRAAIATGSRLRKDSRTTRSLKREIISRTYNFIIKRAVLSGFSDAQCGFKAIRREAAVELLPLVKDNAWFFDTELLAKAERRGWPVHEVPVQWIEDPDSRVNIVKTAADDLKGLARLRREFGMTSAAENAALAALLIGTTALYTFNLSINGYANSYYAAAVQAAGTSWKALFFGSLDGASFITVDKPPVAVWFMGLSARLFGFSSFSMLLPSALAGVATVALVYASVKRPFGVRSGLIAGSVMALMPVAALMFRFNNPDSFLTLFLTASAYTFFRALEGRRALWWLSLTGLLTGFAFNTKMLQGLIVVPVMALVYLCCARPRFLVRLRQILLAGVVTAVSTLWWAVAVWLTPAASRPYIGSTSNDSIWSLIFGYNGFGRLLGKGSGMGGRGAMGGMGPGGPGGNGFGGHTGILRIFNGDFGPNIAWLIPLALLSAGLTVWLLRRMPRDNRQRAAILLWTGWMVLHIAVFSITSGVIHPYYPVVMAPAIAALIGIGAPYIWKAYSRGTSVAWILPLSIAASAITAFVLLSYEDYWPWLAPAVLLAGSLSSLLFFIAPERLGSSLKRLAGGLALAAVAAGPIAFSFSTVTTAHSGSIPTAGPSGTALSRTNNESATADNALVAYLLRHRAGAAWIVAVASANESAPIQISSGQPVMAVGGFNGGDTALTLDQFKQLVAAGKLRYYAVSSDMNGGGGGGRMGGRGGNSQITEWVTANATKVDYGGSGTTLYQLTK